MYQKNVVLGHDPTQNEKTNKEKIIERKREGESDQNKRKQKAKRKNENERTGKESVKKCACADRPRALLSRGQISNE